MSKVKISAAENLYFTSYFDVDLKLYEIVWHEASQDMEEEEYKKYLLNEKSTLAKYKQINLVLVNLQNRLDTMSPELQEWSSANIAPFFLEKITKLKIAVVRSQDFSTQFSLEQAFEEDSVSEDIAITRHFDNEQMAKEWLLDTQL
ncbi:MAG TPA: hypothetical protein DCS93_02475 [Microscillaceae bacterium]|nr:hypothetical protein [Microscillaceae bacterium]